MMDRRRSSPDMPNRRFRLAVCNTFRILVRLVFRLEYQGLEHVPEQGPAILAANHTSMMDMFVIHTAIRPWIHWVAKIELFRKRFLADILFKLGCIPVDRDRTDLQAARGIFTALRNRQVIGMFPQGTRVAPDRISQVRPRNGTMHFAIKTGVPLLPVMISGRFRLFGRIRIIFGPAWKPDVDPHTRLTAADLDQLSLELMRRIYRLAGLEYHLAVRGGKD
jgi:1-acyl-sn-glycerol-3-phosphate acyltransferase